MSPPVPVASVETLLEEGRRRLHESGVRTPGLDAQVLLAEALGCQRAALFARAKDPVAPDARETYRRFLDRRAAREPVALILGRREFFGLSFTVTPDVLVPRPETELLVSLGLERIRAAKGPVRALDVGTGSGCVAVSLARLAAENGVDLRVTAVDCSDAALRVAERNAGAHGVADRVLLEKADALDPEWTPRGAPFQLLLSNPPYVASGDIALLEPEVSRWEPRRALDGGPDGLSFIRGFLARVPGWLSGGGTALLEVGAGQAAAVAREAAGSGLQLVAVHRDLAGIERVVELRLP